MVSNERFPLNEDRKKKVADDAEENNRSFEARLQHARNISMDSAFKGKAPLPEEGKIKAMRIGTELVVAIFVGGGLGFLIDSWLGTKPWFLIGFLFLGNAAGLWNIFRLTNNHKYKAGFSQDRT